MTLQVWVSTDHDGHWRSGASVMVAQSEMEARVVLSEALDRTGLSADAFTLRAVPLDRPLALVLVDGDS